MIPVLDSKALVAVWDDTDVPVCEGQRLLALRTHTENRTMYLFDHDGERLGWVSGDVLDAAGYTPSRSDTFLAKVKAVDSERYKRKGRFTVELYQLNRNNLADKLRAMPGWPQTLGDGPEDLRADFPLLYEFLTSTKPLHLTLQPETKDTTMNKTSIASAVTGHVSRAFSDNADAMKNAAFLEAGVIVNRQLAKVAGAKAPFMVKGYVDTPIGKLVIANLFKAIVHELRPNDQLLQRLSDASLEAAHLDVIRTLDLDGLIDDLLSVDAIKRAVSKMDGSAE